VQFFPPDGRFFTQVAFLLIKENHRFEAAYLDAIWDGRLKKHP